MHGVSLAGKQFHEQVNYNCAMHSPARTVRLKFPPSCKSVCNIMLGSIALRTFIARINYTFVRIRRRRRNDCEKETKKKRERGDATKKGKSTPRTNLISLFERRVTRNRNVIEQIEPFVTCSLWLRKRGGRKEKDFIGYRVAISLVSAVYWRIITDLLTSEYVSLRIHDYKTIAFSVTQNFTSGRGDRERERERERERARRRSGNFTKES